MTEQVRNTVLVLKTVHETSLILWTTKGPKAKFLNLSQGRGLIKAIGKPASNKLTFGHLSITPG